MSMRLRQGIFNRRSYVLFTLCAALLLHGTAHALTLNFEIGRAGQAITATTHFPIPYVAWGIKDPSNFAIKVDKEVSMDIIAKGSLTTEK